MDTITVPPHDRRPLIGREREHEQLRAHLTRALAGHGGLVLIGGEAGIGKTTLVGDLIRQAEAHSALVLRGGCYDLTTTPPYGPWAEAIRAYRTADGQAAVPAWFGAPEELARAASQAELLEDARRLFAGIAEHQPMVIVLEDLHWADPGSLEVLRYLGRHLDTSAILIVTTYRSDELERGDELARLLPVLVRESRARRIHLNRLDQDAVNRLIEDRYALDENDLERLSAHIWARSEGNPFFAGEILQGLEEEQVLRPGPMKWELGDLDRATVPMLLRQILDVRLTRLSPDTHSALQIASVIGQEVPLDLWRAIVELDASQQDQVVAEAMQMHLLEASPGAAALRFRHALLREALYESIFPVRRQAVHRLSGEALAATPSPDPDAVAHHFRQAGDRRELAWLVRAGLRARRTAAFLTAVERFERAAALLEGDQEHVRERGWLLFYAVFLSRYYGELRPDSMLDEAERLALAARDRVLATSIRFHRGLRFSLRGQVRRGLQAFRAAVEEYEDLARVECVAHVDLLAPAAIQALLPDGGPPPNELSPTPALSSLPSQRRAPTVTQSILATWLGFGGHYREALETGEAIVEEMIAAYADEHLRMIPGASGHFALGQAYAVLGRTNDSRREFGLARRGYELIGDYSMTDISIWSDLLLAVIPYQTEQLAERSRLAGDSVKTRTGSVSLSHAADLESPGVIAVNLIEGRWTEARQQAERLQSAYAVPLVQSGIAFLGIVAREQGEPGVAWVQVMKLLPEGPDTEPGDSYFPATSAVQRLAAGLALDRGDLELANRWIEAHERWLEWSGTALWHGDHLLLTARYHQIAGDLDRAAQLAEAARKFAGDPRQPLVLLAANRLLGTIATREQRFAEAGELLRASLDLASACAAPFERALTLVEMAGLARATGNPSGAREALDEARDVGVALGALRVLERIGQLDHELSDGPIIFPDGLTPREAEILRLVAAGKSNLQIAKILFLSSRTVERHVANIYRKIDAHNRAEATAYALGRRLI